MIQKRLLFLRKLLKSFKQFVVYVLSDGGVLEAREYINTQMEKAQNASILQIPSAFKTSVLYNQIPINPSEDFDVVRNSDVWRTNESGYYENIGVNVPCIDYTDGFPVLLTQPQSTNFIKNSSTLSLQSINNAGVMTDNAAISPEGIQNAAIYETDGVTSSYVRTFVTFTSTSAAQLATYSYHVKYIDNQWFRFRTVGISGQTIDVYFDILNGVIGTNSSSFLVTPKIKPLKDGWFRLSVTAEYDFSVDNADILQVYIVNGDGIAAQTAGKQIAIYEPQAEELGYASTPIKTGAAVVTRLQDELTGAGSTSTINSEEGVLLINAAIFESFELLPTNYKEKVISINNGFSDKMIRINYDDKVGRIQIIFINGATTQSIFTANVDVLNFNEIAVSWDSVNLRLYVNGVFKDTVVLSNIFSPNTLNNISLNANSQKEFNGKLKELRVYKSIAEAKIDLPYIT